MDIISKIAAKSNLRYERKFTVNATHASAIELMIKRHPAFFRTLYPKRQINNIYLDTDGLTFYEANKIGISERQKVRVRWYGALFGRITSPILEFKIKHGLVGDKWSWKLADFDFEKGFSMSDVNALLDASDLPMPVREALKPLKPSLLNSYHRSYFQSADQQYRLTLDEQLIYYRIDRYQNSFLQKRKTPEEYIVELKYGLDMDSHVDSISAHLPYRMDKSSKYVNGIDLLNSIK